MLDFAAVQRRKASYLQWHQDEDGSIVGSFRLTPEQGAPFCHVHQRQPE